MMLLKKYKYKWLNWVSINKILNLMLLHEEKKKLIPNFTKQKTKRESCWSSGLHARIPSQQHGFDSRPGLLTEKDY